MARKKQKPGSSSVPPDGNSSRTYAVPNAAAAGADVRRLNRFRIAAYFSILAVFLVAATLTRFEAIRMLLPAQRESLPYSARVALFAMLSALVVRWVYATDYEWKLWIKLLKNPVQKNQVYAAIVILALMLGLCLAFAWDIVVISLLFTVYLLFNYWTQWLSNDYLSRALETSRRTFLGSTQSRVLNVMEHYWLRRPQLARITTMMFFAALAFSLAMAGAVLPEPYRRRLQIFACVIVVMNILISEIVIALWRHQRNRDIARAADFKAPAKAEKSKEKIAREPYVARFDTFRTAAYWAIPGIFLGTIAVNEFKNTMLKLPATWEESWLFAARIIFFLELSVLAILWIAATGDEMELWIDHLENPVGKQQVRVAVFGLALVLGVLLAFAHNIVFVSGFITVYLLVNYWTQWLTNDHFTRALERTRAAGGNAAKKKVLNVMESYWLGRPQLARITTMMFFTSIAFSLALKGTVLEHAGSEKEAELFQLAAYALVFLDILAGEIVIARWRHDRNQQISQARGADK